jgi:hypothetical protein
MLKTMISKTKEKKLINNFFFLLNNPKAIQSRKKIDQFIFKNKDKTILNILNSL